MNHAETSIAQFPGREIPVLEWSDGEPGPPIIMLSGSGSASDWAGLAAGLATDYRMLALEKSEWPLLMEAIWASGEPAVLVAQGDAAGPAIQVAIEAPGSVRAAVLVDYALPAGWWQAAESRHAVSSLQGPAERRDLSRRRGRPSRSNSRQQPDRAGKLRRMAGRLKRHPSCRGDSAVPVATGRALRRVRNSGPGLKRYRPNSS